MSLGLAIADGADRCIFAFVKERRYFKSRSIPSATWIRSSIPLISPCMRFRRAIWLGRSLSARLFSNLQSSSSSYFFQSTRPDQKF